MAEHYTNNTVEASAWCRVCNKNTMHLVFGRKLGGCQECIKRREVEASQKKPVQSAAVQDRLF